MAVRREQRYPVSEIMAQTPAIPSGCQWGIFLRNHDELTLDMVTDEERDYMWAEYAKDPRMKANIGIRGAGSPRCSTTTATSWSYSPPCCCRCPARRCCTTATRSPWASKHPGWADRDGVRTPMQWTPDRNGGFSLADPARLYLPLIMDPIYGYQALNVEQQRHDSASFLHWTRRMIEGTGRRHPVFGVGRYEELSSSNPSVLAFVREVDEGVSDGPDRVLCVNNLSRFPQPVELDLRRFRGVTPVECMGGVSFPPIGELSYLLHPARARVLLVRAAAAQGRARTLT